LNRAKMNLFLDVLMIAIFLIVAVTSIALFFGYGDRDMRTIHRYVGMALVVILSVHFLLHFKWIASMIKNIFKK
jgi:hypothetical protein